MVVIHPENSNNPVKSMIPSSSLTIPYSGGDLKPVTKHCLFGEATSCNSCNKCNVCLRKTSPLLYVVRKSERSSRLTLLQIYCICMTFIDSWIITREATIPIYYIMR